MRPPPSYIRLYITYTLYTTQQTLSVRRERRNSFRCHRSRGDSLSETHNMVIRALDRMRRYIVLCHRIATRRDDKKPMRRIIARSWDADYVSALNEEAMRFSRRAQSHCHAPPDGIAAARAYYSCVTFSHPQVAAVCRCCCCCCLV